MKLDSGKSGRAELPLTTYISVRRRPEKTCLENLGGEKGQEIWVGSKAQAPKSFLRDFYMANEKRPPETKVGFEGY